MKQKGDRARSHRTDGVSVTKGRARRRGALLSWLSKKYFLYNLQDNIRAREGKEAKQPAFHPLGALLLSSLHVSSPSKALVGTGADAK